jgi:hypothetical protein
MKYELHGITYGTTEWAPDYLAGGLSTAPPFVPVSHQNQGP